MTYIGEEFCRSETRNLEGNFILENFQPLCQERRHDFVVELGSTKRVLTRRYFDNKLPEDIVTVLKRNLHFLRDLDVEEMLRIQEERYPSQRPKVTAQLADMNDSRESRIGIGYVSTNWKYEELVTCLWRSYNAPGNASNSR